MRTVKFYKTVQAMIVALGVLGAVSASAAETYSFDKGHTEIRFSWNHVGLSTQSARFLEFDGIIVIDTQDPAKSSVNVSFNTDSIKTTIAAFDKDIKSSKFFDTSTFPKATFKSTSVRQVGKSFVEITGDLTIKGITKPVTLDAELLFMGPHPLGPYLSQYKGATYAGFKARGQILRSDFDLGAYGPLVSDRVVININTELRRNDAQ